MVHTLESKITLFGVGDIGDHIVAHMVFMSVKDHSHKMKNKLELLQQVFHMCSKVSKILAYIDHVT